MILSMQHEFILHLIKIEKSQAIFYRYIVFTNRKIRGTYKMGPQTKQEGISLSEILHFASVLRVIKFMDFQPLIHSL